MYCCTATEFAYNSAVTEDLVTSSFEMDWGLIRKSPMDVVSGAETPIESIKEFKKRLQALLMTLKTHMRDRKPKKVFCRRNGLKLQSIKYFQRYGLTRSCLQMRIVSLKNRRGSKHNGLDHSFSRR